MIAAFAKNGANIKSLFSFSNNILDRHSYLQQTYGVLKKSLGNPTFISTHARGFRYLFWLTQAMFTAHNNSTVYTRENTEFYNALWIRKITGNSIRIVHEVHKLIAPHSNKSVTNIPFFDKLSQADGIVFIDEALRDRVLSKLNLKAPTIVAPSGANILSLSSTKSPTPTAKIVLGYFGKIVEDKGVFLLADSMRFLPERYHLKCIGRIDPETQREMLHRIGNDRRVVFTGHVNHSELQKELSDVHISIIPSISSDKYLSPLKLTESLALGLPLVCTPVEHLKRLVKHEKNAIFAISFHPQDLANAILKLGSDPNCMSAMSAENLEYASQFSWDTRARRILDFIKFIN